MTKLADVQNLFSKLFNEYANLHKTNSSFKTYQAFYEIYIEKETERHEWMNLKNDLLIYVSYYHVFIPILDRSSLIRNEVFKKSLIFTDFDLNEIMNFAYKNIHDDENYNICKLLLDNRNIFYNEIWIRILARQYICNVFMKDMKIPEMRNGNDKSALYKDIQKSLLGVLHYYLDEDLIPSILYVRLFFETLFKSGKEHAYKYMPKVNKCLTKIKLFENTKIFQVYEPITIEKIFDLFRTFMNNPLHSNCKNEQYEPIESDLMLFFQEIFQILAKVLYEEKFISKDSLEEFNNIFPLAKTKSFK